MLSVYDGGQKYPITGQSDFYVMHVDGGEDTLAFTVPVDTEIYKRLAEENQVEYRDNRYLIKSINAPSSYADIVCELDLDFLRERFYRNYDSSSVTLRELLAAILPQGWTVTGHDPGIRRTIRLEYATDYDVLAQAAKTYAVRFVWAILSKTVTVINPENKTPSGEYLTDELNLRGVAFKGESTELITRLYPYGADGLTIGMVNDNRDYVDNHQYTDKVICGYWSDERYTDPTSLKIAAEERLAVLSAPQRSYECDVIDLAKLDAQYSDFAFALYKVVTLIDRQRGLRLDHQVLEYKEYPDEPQKNVLTLSSVTPKIQSVIREAVEALDGSIREARILVDEANSEIELRARKDELISLINLSPEAVKIQGNRVEIVGYVTFEDLQQEGKTAINGKNIVTGKIQSASGGAYFDLDAGEIAATKIVSSDGETLLYVSGSGPFSGFITVYRANITDLNCGTITANNLRSMSRQVLTDVALSKIGDTYFLNKSYSTINYWSPSYI